MSFTAPSGGAPHRHCGSTTKVQGWIDNRLTNARVGSIEIRDLLRRRRSEWNDNESGKGSASRGRTPRSSSGRGRTTRIGQDRRPHKRWRLTARRPKPGVLRRTSTVIGTRSRNGDIRSQNDPLDLGDVLQPPPAATSRTAWNGRCGCPGPSIPGIPRRSSQQFDRHIVDTADTRVVPPHRPSSGLLMGGDDG